MINKLHLSVRKTLNAAVKKDMLKAIKREKFHLAVGLNTGTNINKLSHQITQNFIYHVMSVMFRFPYL